MNGKPFSPLEAIYILINFYWIFCDFLLTSSFFSSFFSISLQMALMYKNIFFSSELQKLLFYFSVWWLNFECCNNFLFLELYNGCCSSKLLNWTISFSCCNLSKSVSFSLDYKLNTAESQSMDCKCSLLFGFGSEHGCKLSKQVSFTNNIDSSKIEKAKKKLVYQTLLLWFKSVSFKTSIWLYSIKNYFSLSNDLFIILPFRDWFRNEFDFTGILIFPLSYLKKNCLGL